MKISLDAGLRISHETRQEMRLGQQQELALSLATSIEALLKERGDDPSVAHSSMYDRVVPQIPDPSLQDIFRMESIKNKFIEIVHTYPDLAINPERTEKLALHLVYAQFDGTFTLQDKKSEGAAPPAEVMSVVYADLDRAFFKPDEVQQEIDLYTSEIKRTGSNNPATADARRRLQSALTVARSLREVVSHFSNLFELFLKTKEPGANIDFRDHTAEHILFENMIRSSSMRTVAQLTTGARRFFQVEEVKRFQRNRVISPNLEHVIMNHVGKTVLVGLGIVDKDLFTVMHGNAQIYEDRDFSGAFQKITGHDPIEMLKKNNLTTEKYYFSRYKTTQVRPTSDTDAKVRDFFTTTIRRDSEQILTAMGIYDAYTEEANSIEHGASPEDRDIATYTFLKKILEKPEFIEFLKKNIVKYSQELSALTQ